jgi:uncharacterized protein YjbI with pentapeptide repeats
MTIRTIHRIDKTILASEEAPSILGLIQRLAKRGVDLSHMDLSHLPDTDLRLSGLYLPKGTKARGVNWGHASLNESVMKEVDLSRCIWENVSLNAANMNKSILSGGVFKNVQAQGIVLTSAVVDACTFEDTSFIGSWSNGTSFKNSYFMDCNLTNAKMCGSDHRNTTHIRSNFRASDFESYNSNGKRKCVVTKNYWLDASVRDCKFDKKTRFPWNAEALARGKKNEDALRGLAVFTSAASVALAATWVEDLLKDHGMTSSSPAIIIGTSGLVFAVMPVLHEFASKYVKDFLKDSAIKIGNVATECYKSGARLSKLVMVAGKKKELLPLRAALESSKLDELESRRTGIWNEFKSLVRHDNEIIICDKSHLNAAMKKLTGFMQESYTPKTPVILVNPSLPKGASASITLSHNGVLKGVFLNKNDEKTVIIYDRFEKHLSVSIAKNGEQAVSFSEHIANQTEVEDIIMNYFMMGFNKDLNQKMWDAGRVATPIPLEDHEGYEDYEDGLTGGLQPIHQAILDATTEETPKKLPRKYYLVTGSSPSP